MSRRIVILGGGPMGTAIAVGLRKSQLGSELRVVEIDAERRRVLSEKYQIEASETHVPAAGDVVVLAIQPQAFQSFAAGLAPNAYSECLLISVMAGIRIETMCHALGTNQVVRSIPNTPSEVMQGMTVLCPGHAVEKPNIDLARDILGSFGKALVVTREEAIDDATALCGGGPAFVAFYAKGMFDFAVECGFEPNDARTMVAQVLRGTADLLAVTGKEPLVLCKEVMTPNGTTERGIWHYRERELDTIVTAALRRSAARSRELSGV
ncbi:pyrroline-5-carboxylate reductase [Pendulispora rubella]|uniref:Pyrroline-5-carboxylate reductase n=1 Tax=Pendulispora rubella TaxID=2741070 RepID=A0ABZ2LJL2_9BACT